MTRIDAIEARVAAIEAQAPSEGAINSGASKICKVDGCNDPYRSKGFCGRHYQAWRRGSLAGFPA
jgi:hypothetical protein